MYLVPSTVQGKIKWGSHLFTLGIFRGMPKEAVSGDSLSL